MFLEGKMRKSGGTNVPPLLLVEYNTLRAALVKGRRSVSSKVELKSVCFFSLPKRDFKRRNREEKKQRERAETEVVTKRID
jgi:hypothetical protein